MAARLGAGTGWQRHDLFFTTTIGTPLVLGTALRRSYRPLQTRDRLPALRFHDVRHTAATLLLARGAHPKIASERLYHSRVAITFDLDSHVTEPMQRRAPESMDTLLATLGQGPSAAACAR